MLKAPLHSSGPVEEFHFVPFSPAYHMQAPVNPNILFS